MESWNTETYNTEQQYSPPLYSMIMAVQLTEFCPPRRRNERTNEVPRGIRNYFSQSNEQDAKLVLLFQGVYFFSFSFFFYRISKRIFFPLEKAWKRVSKREGERERPRVSRNFRYFERNCRESIWKIRYFSRWTRVHRGEFTWKGGFKAYLSENSTYSPWKKRETILFERNIRFSFPSFHRESRRIKEQLWGKRKKKKIFSLPFLPSASRLLVKQANQS